MGRDGMVVSIKDDTRRQISKRAFLLGAAAALSAVTPTFADMPREIAETVRKIGPVINPPETIKLYEAMHAKEPYQNVVVARDQKYGPHDRNRLDVFRASEVASLKPVLIFLHGGGYEHGDKRTGTSPFYDNVMLWAVANGMVGVNMTYRLAPAASWPAGTDDVAAAVAWTEANIKAYGGDPGRIFIFGHSAGATHVGDYLARGSSPAVKGGILLSGTFALDPNAEQPGQKAYFGDTSLWSERSSIRGLANSTVPLLVAHGEIDVPYYIKQAEALKTALCEKGHCPTFVSLKDHSHMSEIYAVNTADTSLTSAIIAFVKKAQQR